MSEVNHSPTPWATETGVYGLICDSNGMFIVDTAGCSTLGLGQANADYIVMCVNSHDALTAEVARLEAVNAKMREALSFILSKATETSNEDAVCALNWIDETASHTISLAAEGGAK